MHSWDQPIQRANGIEHPSPMVTHMVETKEGGAGFQPLAHLPGHLVKDAQIKASALQDVML